MPGQLLIAYSYGNWNAFISNTPVSYKFSGATSDLQSQQVRALQNAMSQGEDEVTNNLQTIFSNVQEGDEELVFNQLFRGTNVMRYGEATSFFEVNIEEDSLADEIDAAAEWFALVLA